MSQSPMSLAYLPFLEHPKLLHGGPHCKLRALVSWGSAEPSLHSSSWWWMFSNPLLLVSCTNNSAMYCAPQHDGNDTNHSFRGSEKSSGIAMEPGAGSQSHTHGGGSSQGASCPLGLWTLSKQVRDVWWVGSWKCCPQRYGQKRRQACTTAREPLRGLRHRPALHNGSKDCAKVV